MGLVAAPANVALETIEGKAGLGTPTPNAEIAPSPGAAATASFAIGVAGEVEAFVTLLQAWMD
jgi:hypothetical protein